MRRKRDSAERREVENVERDNGNSPRSENIPLGSPRQSSPVAGSIAREIARHLGVRTTNH